MARDSDSTVTIDPQYAARGVVRAISDTALVLVPTGTNYEIHLTLTPGDAPQIAAGQRVKGFICAEALRVHPNAAGGQFIEPLWGRPRIICGTVREINHEDRVMVVDAAVPFVLELTENDDLGAFFAGGMVNCYVESDTRFLLLR